MTQLGKKKKVYNVTSMTKAPTQLGIEITEVCKHALPSSFISELMFNGVEWC